jgi:hypothetical protein
VQGEGWFGRTIGVPVPELMQPARLALPYAWQELLKGESMFKRHKESPEIKPSSQHLYDAMRLVAFEAAQKGTIQPRNTYPDLFGLLVDIAPTPGKSPGYIAIAAMGDNTARMYSDIGGPMAQIEGSATAAPIRQLLETVQTHLSSFAAGDDGGRPGVGTVRFHALTQGTGRFADVPTEAFWGRADHSLMPVIIKTQGVFCTLRTGKTP